MSVAANNVSADLPVDLEIQKNKPFPLEEDQSIGDLIRRAKGLSASDMDAIVDYQNLHGIRFGEAAVALGLASEEDVVFALSRQFNYPYAPEERREACHELVVSSQPFSKQAEAFRAIRSQLLVKVFSPTALRRVVAIVSPQSGDGKSFFSANLAVSLAQLGGRTLIVDADLRSPRLHEIFNVPNSGGLSGVLSGRQDDHVIYQAPDIPSLFVMPVGVIPPNPLELLERPAFKLMLGELLRKFDYVLVDSPAAAYGSDAAVIASKCGAALVLARKNYTKTTELQELVSMVTIGSSQVVGVVVNEY